MAGPILSHVSIVEHGVPVMMRCGAKNAKKKTMFLAATFLDFDRGVQRQHGTEAEGQILHNAFLSPRLRTVLEKHARPICSHVSIV